MGDTIGIRQLRDRLSATLERVRRGDVVTVTDRGRRVALIVPLTGASDAEVVARLAETGLVSWSGGKPAGSARPPVTRGPAVADAVLEDRR